MAMLRKENTLFERDEKGELIPQVVKLEIGEDNKLYDEIKDSEIMIIPMTRGEIKRIFSFIKSDKEEKDVDEELIFNHCVEPKYTKDEIKVMKPEFVTPIVDTILKHSGLDNTKPKKQAMQEAEDDFSKN